MAQIFGRSSKALARRRLVLKHVDAAAMVCFRIARFYTSSMPIPSSKRTTPILPERPEAEHAHK
jgi:hypothetical protein